MRGGDYLSYLEEGNNFLIKFLSIIYDNDYIIINLYKWFSGYLKINV